MKEIEYTEDFRKRVESLQDHLVRKYELDLLEAADLHNELQHAIKQGTISASTALSGAFPLDQSIKGLEYWKEIENRI